MSAILQLTLEPLWSVLFGARCVLCGARQQHAICADCQDAITGFDCQTCDRCDHPLDRHAACPDCSRLGEPAFTRTFAVGPYRGILKEAVLALKYRDGWRVADVLAQHLARRVRQIGLCPDAAIAIPIDAERQAARGYSQSLLLASRVAVHLGIPHRRGVLRRRVHGVVQSTADMAQRHAQVTDIFEVRGQPHQGSVLLVDDVMTTAATMHAAASVLRARGAQVWGAVVARQTLRRGGRK